MWSYKLPKPIDPSNTTITITLFYDIGFFAYDQGQTTIKQIKVADKQLKKAITIKLINENGVQASYSMNVEFSCTKDSTV
jgi:hypothetical protein